jgi:malonyl-CoA/methylmalonyl-CoA synthetase
MANLYDRFRACFPVDRARAFIELEDGRVYTYAEAEAISARYARFLRSLGVVKGERVAVQVEKCPEAVFLYLACLRAGAAFLPLNTAYQKAEIEYFLADAEPRLVVGTPEAEAAMAAAAAKAKVPHALTLAGGGGSLVERSRGFDGAFDTVPVADDDLAALLYTSGTTGRSKGAMLTHENLRSNAAALHRSWGFRPDDVLLHALPIFHTHGLFVAINCVLLNGSPMIFLPRFDADKVLKLLPRATVFMGVPTFYVRLLAHPGLTPQACRAIRVFISGSAPLLKDTFVEFQKRTGHTILERYGMTETGMNTSNPLDGERRAATVGFPLPGVEVRVADDKGAVLPANAVGVIEVRGPNVFKGYWRMPEKTAEEFRADGFFITGDVGMIDERGYVHIVGRAKDLIISGGFNVYPKEIETMIDEVDGVAESAVIGLPHADFGEAVTAIVKRRPGRGDLTEESIVAALKGQIAAFKVPKRVFFVDELPRNSMGKVQKNMLRDRYKNTYAAGADLARAGGGQG